MTSCNFYPIWKIIIEKGWNFLDGHFQNSNWTRNPWVLWCFRYTKICGIQIRYVNIYTVACHYIQVFTCSLSAYDIDYRTNMEIFTRRLSSHLRGPSHVIVIRILLISIMFIGRTTQLSSRYYVQAFPIFLINEVTMCGYKLSKSWYAPSLINRSF